MLNTQAATAIVQIICDHDATIPDLISFVLHHAPLQDHPITQNILDHPTEIIAVLVDCPVLHECIVDWALCFADRLHSKSVQHLSRVQNGWHFSALHTSVEQIQEFRVEDFILTVQADEPALWRTVTNLLAADNKLTCRRSSCNLADNQADADADDDDEDKEQFWVGLDTRDVGAGEGDPDNSGASVPWS